MSNIKRSNAMNQYKPEAKPFTEPVAKGKKELKGKEEEFDMYLHSFREKAELAMKTIEDLISEKGYQIKKHGKNEVKKINEKMEEFEKKLDERIEGLKTKSSIKKDEIESEFTKMIREFSKDAKEEIDKMEKKTKS